MASWIQLAMPEARKRLSEASSQEKTSGVMPSSNSALENRSASRISFESIVGLSPDASVSVAPKLNMSDRQLRFASLQWENAMPVGLPLGLSVRAAPRGGMRGGGSGPPPPLASFFPPPPPRDVANPDVSRGNEVPLGKKGGRPPVLPGGPRARVEEAGAGAPRHTSPRHLHET